LKKVFAPWLGDSFGKDYRFLLGKKKLKPMSESQPKQKQKKTCPGAAADSPGTLSNFITVTG